MGIPGRTTRSRRVPFKNWISKFILKDILKFRGMHYPMAFELTNQRFIYYNIQYFKLWNCKFDFFCSSFEYTCSIKSREFKRQLRTLLCFLFWVSESWYMYNIFTWYILTYAWKYCNPCKIKRTNQTTKFNFNSNIVTVTFSRKTKISPVLWILSWLPSAHQLDLESQLLKLTAKQYELLLI